MQVRLSTVFVIGLGFVLGFVAVRYLILQEMDAPPVDAPVAAVEVQESEAATQGPAGETAGVPDPVETESAASEPAVEDALGMPPLEALAAALAPEADLEHTATEYATISGLVLSSATGAPVAGAKVTTSFYHEDVWIMEDFDFSALPDLPGVAPDEILAMIPRPSDAGAEALSAEDGSFSLEVPLFHREHAKLFCLAPGFARSEKPLRELLPTRDARTARVDFLLEAGAGVTGRVTLAGSESPLPNVQVKFMDAQRASHFDFESALDSGQSARTDADGVYRLDSLAPGVYRVGVRDPAGNVLPRNQRLSAQVAAGETLEGFDITLEAGAIIQGTITDPAGNPVEDAMISALPQALLDGGSLDFSELMLADNEQMDWSEESGAYTLRGLHFGSTYVLSVSADELAVFHSEPFSIAQGRSPHIMDVRLGRGSSVSGVAKYEDGTLAAGIRVNTLPDYSSMLELMHDSHDARTDAQGRFTLKNLPAGKHTISAGWSHRRDYTVDVEVDGTRDVDGVVLAVRGAPRPGVALDEITGRVTDLDDSPVPGARVTLYEFGEEASVAQASTDADGRFSLRPVDPEELYRVAAESDGRRGERKYLKAGEEVRLRIGHHATVSGLVVDQDGEPVARSRVYLTPVHSEEEDSVRSRFFSFTEPEGAASNDSGYWEIKDVGPGRYTAVTRRADRGHAESAEFEVEEGGDVQNLLLKLEPGLALSGRATDAAGRPVAGAEIHLREQSDNPEEEQMLQFMPVEMQTGALLALSAADGSFHFEHLRPGRYAVRATHPSHAPFILRDVSMQRDVHDVRVVFQDGGCVTGQPGRPGMMITLMGDAGSSTASTGADGRFEVCGLAPGQYMLMAMDMQEMMGGVSGMPRTRTVIVESGRTTEVDFAPPAGSVPVHGQVHGAAGDELELVLRRPDALSIHDIEDTWDFELIMEAMSGMSHATLGANGAFVLEEVAPGDYILEIFDMSHLHEHDFDDWDGVHVDCIHTREPLLSQEVRVEAGQPLELELNLPVQ